MRCEICDIRLSHIAHRTSQIKKYETITNLPKMGKTSGANNI